MNDKVIQLFGTNIRITQKKMTEDRLNRCNAIRAKLAELRSTRDAIQNKLVLSVDNRILDDPVSLAAAKKVILSIYDTWIAEKATEFEEA